MSGDLSGALFGDLLAIEPDSSGLPAGQNAPFPKPSMEAGKAEPLGVGFFGAERKVPEPTTRSHQMYCRLDLHALIYERLVR